MSYCRFTEGDVYSYECDGGVQFYVSDGRRELDRLCNTFNEAYQYAEELRDTHGLDVPNHAIESLKADALEEAARICGPDSAVADLQSENDKLRSLVRGLYTNLSDLQRAICNSEDMWGYAKYYEECLISARKLMRELGIGVEP